MAIIPNQQPQQDKKQIDFQNALKNLIAKQPQQLSSGLGVSFGKETTPPIVEKSTLPKPIEKAGEAVGKVLDFSKRIADLLMPRVSKAVERAQEVGFPQATKEFFERKLPGEKGWEEVEKYIIEHPEEVTLQFAPIGLAQSKPALAIRQLAKETTVEKIKPILKDVFNLAEEEIEKIAPQIAKETKPQVIQRIIEQARGIAKPITEEIIPKIPKAETAVKKAEEIKKVVSKAGGIDDLPPELREFLENPKDDKRVRQHIVKILTSEKVPSETKSRLVREIEKRPEILFRGVMSDKLLLGRAREYVSRDPEAAFNKLLTEGWKTEFHEAIARQLVKVWSKSDNPELKEKAFYILTNMVPEYGTDVGRKLRLMKLWQELEPEELVLKVKSDFQKFQEKLDPVSKFLARNKLKLTPDDEKIIKDLATKAQQATSEVEKLKHVRRLEEFISSKIPWTLRDILYELWNIPRTMMAGMLDFSATLMQNIAFAYRHPFLTAKNFIESVKDFLSKQHYEEALLEIATRPNAPLYEKANLALTDLTHDRLLREEQFRSLLAEKIPGLGGIIKATERAWTGFLNRMRADVADQLINTARQVGIDIEKDERFLKTLGDFVNAATGRGNLGKLAIASKEISQILFSPRKIVAALQMMNPLFYMRLHPVVRKEALKTLLSWLAGGTTILGLAWLNGLEVGTDPRSADFGKIKWGNTRINVFGEFSRVATILARLLTGEYVSSITGRKYELGVGYKPMTRWEILARWFETKEHPSLSFIRDALTGRTFAGEEFKFGEQLFDLFIPMVIQDINDLIEEHGPTGFLLAPFVALGLSVQTYGDLSKGIPYFKLLPSGQAKIETEMPQQLGERLYRALFGLPSDRIYAPAGATIGGRFYSREDLIFKDQVDKEKTYLRQQKTEIKRKLVEGQINQQQAYDEIAKLKRESINRLAKMYNEIYGRPMPLELLKNLSVGLEYEDESQQ